MLLSWFKKNKANRRQSPRFSTCPQLRCVLNCRGDQLSCSVQMLDISESGFSFITQDTDFNIGGKFDIHMFLNDARWMQTPCQIISRQDYLPFGANEVQISIYRISGKFENALDSQKFQKLCFEPITAKTN